MCAYAVENEVHFVTECKGYGDLRHHLFSEVLRISNGVKNLFEEDDKNTIFRIVAGIGWGDEEWSKICQVSLNFVYLSMKRRAQILKDRLV